MVKNPPAMHEMRLGSLGREDALENEMATHSSILAWEMPWAEEPGGLQSMGSQRVRHNLVTNTLRHSNKQKVCCIASRKTKRNIKSLTNDPEGYENQVMDTDFV